MSEVTYYEIYSTSPSGRSKIDLKPFNDLNSAKEYAQSNYGSFNIVKVIKSGEKIIATELVDSYINIY